MLSIQGHSRLSRVAGQPRIPDLRSRMEWQDVACHLLRPTFALFQQLANPTTLRPHLSNTSTDNRAKQTSRRSRKALPNGSDTSRNRLENVQLPTPNRTATLTSSYSRRQPNSNSALGDKHPTGATLISQAVRQKDPAGPSRSGPGLGTPLSRIRKGSKRSPLATDTRKEANTSILRRLRYPSERLHSQSHQVRRILLTLATRGLPLRKSSEVETGEPCLEEKGGEARSSKRGLVGF